MASPTQWTWVWVNSRNWWWTGRPGMLQFMGLQRVGHDWATELNWTESGKGGHAKTRKEQSRNSSAALGQGPGRGIHINLEALQQNETIPLPRPTPHHMEDVSERRAQFNSLENHRSSDHRCQRISGLKERRPCTYHAPYKASLLLLLLSHFSCVQLCATPQTVAHQAPPSLGFSRQEHWSGLQFPSPMHESEKWKWSRSVMSNPQRPHGLQPSRLLCPWDFPGRSTGVGCHCLLL